MADIIGDNNNNILDGTCEADTIIGAGGNDTINGDQGDDVLYGDGTGQTPIDGTDTNGPICLSQSNAVDIGCVGDYAQAGDFVVYNNVTTTADGSSVSARLVLVETTSPYLKVDLIGNYANLPIVLRGAGEFATFRLEFFDPDTGEDIAIDSSITFGDLQGGWGVHESVSVEADDISAYSTSSTTRNTVVEDDGIVSAIGGGGFSTGAYNQSQFVNFEFEGATSFEFTLAGRSTDAGYSVPGSEISSPITTTIDDSDQTPFIDGDDLINGGDGNDKIFGGGGDDTLNGDDGVDTIFGGDGNDIISGGQGGDVLKGQAGNDTIIGGDDDDTLIGGVGDDRLVLDGNGNDVAYGGQGSDTFVVTAGEHEIIGGEDADGNDVDVIDLSGAGEYSIDYTSAESGTINFLDANGDTYRRTEFSEIEKIICFTPDTMIATMSGEIRVQDIQLGDRVLTRDNGAQFVTWIGTKDVSQSAGTLTENLQPILICKGALGNDLPLYNTRVSPNHRVLITGSRTQLYFEESEILVAAKHLVGMPGIERAPTDHVEYVHFLCERHEVVLSNGAWTESFQPNDYSLSGLGSEQRDEIFTLFPELSGNHGLQKFASARRSLKKFEAQLLHH